MNNVSLTQAAVRGFCTFCMDMYDPPRIAAHLRRCRDRRDDSDCINLPREKVPMAFHLLAAVEGRPEDWLALEAHCQARLSDLDWCIRTMWFPEFEQAGVFSFRKSRRRASGREGLMLEGERRLDECLILKDRICFRARSAEAEVEINLDVTGHLPTAIMHRPIDVVAFPHGWWPAPIRQLDA